MASIDKGEVKFEEGEIEELMEDIAKEMKINPYSRKLKALNKRLDHLMGTELKEEDQEKAEAWEESHRE